MGRIAGQMSRISRMIAGIEENALKQSAGTQTLAGDAMVAEMKQKGLQVTEVDKQAFRVWAVWQIRGQIRQGIMDIVRKSPSN